MDEQECPGCGKTFTEIVDEETDGYDNVFVEWFCQDCGDTFWTLNGEVVPPGYGQEV